MTADQAYDQAPICCHCPFCARQDETGFVAESLYPIPNGPKIPNGPGIPSPPKIPTGPTIPNPPKIPDPPTGPTTPGAPVPVSGSGGGYTGPRFHTLLRGDDWNGDAVGVPALVMYSFATRSLSNYTMPGDPGQAGFNRSESEPLDANQRASIREALKLWEQVSGLFFFEVPDLPELDFNGIRFSMENLDHFKIPGILGISEPNSSTYGFNIQFALDKYAGDPLQMGSDAFYTAMHEIGHAIGLKHPFHGSPNLSAAEDNGNNTVMSYTPAGNYTHLGPFDVDAVRHIYGTQQVEETAPVRWARGPGGSLVTTDDDAGNVVAGLFVRDVVFGNGGDDLIQTLGGDDEIAPGAGDDAVFGGAGTDTLVTGVLRLEAKVALGRGQGTVALPDGTDSFYQVEVIRFLDGDLVVSADSAAGQVYRLYGAALGREPDAVGLSHWTSALQSGAISLPGAASAFIGAPESASSYGFQSNAAFVSTLYQNVLGRPSDAQGLQFWTDAMRAGLGRTDVLLAFSDSGEYRAKTDGAFAEGLWIVDLEAMDVVRAYVAVLDRLPDAGGLESWTAARNAGLGQSDLIGGFVGSAEFEARFGGLSNRGFVEQLYRTSLDREADAGGLAAWTHALDAGLDSRAGVALGFASSAEMTVKVAPLVADGVFFA